MSPRPRRRPSPPAGEPELHHSAGGVVVRAGEVLLISTRGGRRWQLPKGHLEAGETAEEAALREVREETGVVGKVLAPLRGVDYTFVEQEARRITKHVDYFLLGYESGSEADFDPGEVSGAAWFPWDEALSRLSFANERRVVAEAKQLDELVREAQRDAATAEPSSER